MVMGSPLTSAGCAVSPASEANVATQLQVGGDRRAAGVPRALDEVGEHPRLELAFDL